MRRAAPCLVAALAACGGHTAQPASTSPAAPARPAAAAALPTTLRYTPGAGRYRMEVATQVAQEMMGQTTDVALTQSLVLSTSLAAEGANLTLSVTVDSISVTGNSPGVDAAALNSARGSTVRAAFTPSGHAIASPTPADSGSAIVQQLRRTFREFLATLPEGPVGPGTSWTDTVSQSGPIPGGSGQTSSRSIRQHRVSGWEARDGGQALRITTSGTFSISGQGEVQGAPIEMTGTGTATAERWISAAGVYLGSTTSDTTNITVTVTSMGMVIPIHQVSRTTVTRLP